MSDEQLSTIFKRDLPQQDDGDWAADARRRHGRRRATIGGIAVVAALAVVAPFALQLFTKDTDTAVPAPIGTEPATTMGSDDRAAACANAAENPADELPATAERLWLCDEPGEIGLSRTGPSEPLTVGVDEALAAFQELERSQPDMACTMEYTLTYVVVAEGADGTRTPVTGELHGCKTIGNRLGGDAFLTKLGELWAAQRAAAPAPDEKLTAAEICGASASVLPASVEDATQGAMCVADEGTPAAATGELLPEGLVERVVADIEANVVDGTVDQWDLNARLLLTNPWGESVTLRRTVSGMYQWDDKIWRPKGELAAELDALVEPLQVEGQEPPPGQDTEFPEEPVCSYAREAFEGSPAVVEGDVTSVSVCVENRPEGPRWTGLQPLYEPQFVQRAVDAFNALPELEGECEDHSRTEVYVVFSTEQAVSTAVKMTSCGPATSTVSKDGPGFLETLNDLAREQAGELGMGMHYGAQELCPQLDALIEFDPADAGAAQLVACVGSDDAMLFVDVDPAVVEMAAEQITVETIMDGHTEEPEGTLVWVNKWGDPMTMGRLADGSYVWAGSGSDMDTVYRWAPTGELKERLDAIFNL